jgi:hypothetical protein
MRVFVSGATGSIGSVVVPELITARHEVLGLARSDTSAKDLTAAGVCVLRGDLNHPESLRTGAAQSDGVIHLAFGDFNDFPKAIAEETLAVETFASAVVDSGKSLVIASGMPVMPGRAATEQDPFLTEGPLAGRGRNAQTVLDLAERDVRSAVLRLPAQSTPQASAADSPRCSSTEPGAPGSLWLCRRRHPALAGRASPRRRPALPAGPRRRGSRHGGTRGRRRGRHDAFHRRNHRPPAQSADRGRPSRELRLPRQRGRHGPASLQRTDPREVRLAAHPPEPA